MTPEAQACRYAITYNGLSKITTSVAAAVTFAEHVTSLGRQCISPRYEYLALNRSVEAAALTANNKLKSHR